MGSYRIEESANSRAGCSVKACKDNKVKIQKGELRLGVWIETDRFQSWSWRHWGCLTPRVLRNIRDAIDEGGEPNFDLLDGFEELPAEMQEKIKKGIEDGEIPEADKTTAPGEPAGEDVPNGDNKAAEKPKTDTKTKSKTKKRSRTDSEEAEEATTKKAKGRAAGKDESQDEKPAKRTKVRKTAEEPVKEPEPPVKKTRGRKKKAEPAEDEGDATGAEEEPAASPPTKKARGKKTAANGDKPKRGRPKRVASDDE